MPLKTVDQNSRGSVFSYLEDVLTYYKTAEDASFGEWPTDKIGWEGLTLNKPFYIHVESWFTKRNIKVINYNTDRYLSTFIRLFAVSGR